MRHYMLVIHLSNVRPRTLDQILTAISNVVVNIPTSFINRNGGYDCEFDADDSEDETADEKAERVKSEAVNILQTNDANVSVTFMTTID